MSGNRVPIADPQLGLAERERVADVLDSGMLAAGAEVDAFESEFADYCDVDHAVGTANGTTALHAALEAVGVGPGDVVVTTPFSFVATANAIRFAGAIPAFADVDPETFNLDPDAVEARIEAVDGPVAAIVPVHLYGLSAEMDRFREIADEHDAALVADAAQAHDATYRGEPVGSLADAATFSFYPTKNMTTGEGGMVTTDRPEVADALRRFVDHGRPVDGASYEHVELGHNFRMTNLAAAIGRAQLSKLPEFVTARRENAAFLNEALADTPLRTPVEPDDRRHAYHQYTVRTDDRDVVREQFDDHGIGTAVYYPTPITKLAAYEGVDDPAPVAERLADEVLSLPVHPGLDEDDLAQVADAAASMEVPRV
jgi:dTDP-4-amino-4,6-dideoxygalactose transaminase